MLHWVLVWPLSGRAPLPLPSFDWLADARTRAGRVACAVLRDSGLMSSMLWLAAATLNSAPLRAVPSISASAAEVPDAGASPAAANFVSSL